MRITLCISAALLLLWTSQVHAQQADRSAKETSPETAVGEEALRQQIEQLERAFRPSDEVLRKRLAKWEAEFHQAEWTVLRPTRVESRGGATFTTLDDGSLLVSGPRADKDSYHLELRANLPNIAAVRIEALPHESLPHGRCGRGSDGGFVLTEMHVQAGARRVPTPHGRFVRIKLKNPKKKYVSLAEVEVFSRSENIAPAGQATQSSTQVGFPAKLALDGDTEDGGMSTTKWEENPWWELDLGRESPIERIVIWNFAYQRHNQRHLNGFTLSVLDGQKKQFGLGRLRTRKPGS